MNKRVFKKGIFASLLSGLIPVIFSLIIISVVMFGLRQTEESNRAEGVRLLEEAIMRTVIHSYAVEGYFPQSLEYIIETYGLYIDTTRFVVHYQVFAANILPDIRVFELR